MRYAMERIKLWGVFLALALSLVACGDSESVEEDEPLNLTFVANVQDLQYCNKDIFGKVMYVAVELSYFVCTSEGWSPVDSSTAERLIAAYEAAQIQSSSSSLEPGQEAKAHLPPVRVESVSVYGVAQKGPFVTGSSVSIFSLDSMLNALPAKYGGTVVGDSGLFVINNVAFPSQYALVQVSGFYMHEVTGKKTNGMKTTLNALVDLSTGQQVNANVNIFTHLEFLRARQLVTTQNYNVPAAKRRATQEILAAFGFSTDESNLMSTDLSLADTSVAGKTLYMASILLQGDLTPDKFSHRLSGITDFFSRTGTLDTASLIAEFADWASAAEASGTYETIRLNMMNMKVTPFIPDFGSFLYSFWTGAYGLPACNKDAEFVVAKNENMYSSNYGAGYVCSSNHWHKSTPLDEELGFCVADKEGEFKMRDVDGKGEYYVCWNGAWIQIDETQYELKSCTQKRNREHVKTTSGEYFVCRDLQWMKVDSITFELRSCTQARANQLVTTEAGVDYVCEWNGTEGGWRKATSLESRFGVCYDGLKKDVDSVVFAPSGESAALKDPNPEVFLCDNGTWKRGTMKDGGAGFFCGPDNDGKAVETYFDSIYTDAGSRYFFVRGFGMCKDGEWVKLDELEYRWGACVDSMYGKMVETSRHKYYVCTGDDWLEIDSATYVIGKPCEGVSMDTLVHEGFVCTYDMGRYAWREATEGEKATGRTCRFSNSNTLVDDYACVYSVGYMWREASAEEKTTGVVCNRTIADSVLNGYACTYASDDFQWRSATLAENSAGKVCTASLENEFAPKKDFVCQYDLEKGAYAWRGVDTAEKEIGYLCSADKENELDESNTYLCVKKSAGYRWRLATASEIALGGGCTVARAVLGRIYADSVCVSSGVPRWRAATAIEKAAGGVCNSVYARYNSLHEGYFCLTTGWRAASSSEKLVGKPCNTTYYKMFYSPSRVNYRCQDTVAHLWTRNTGSFTYVDTRETVSYTYSYLDIRHNNSVSIDTIMLEDLHYVGSGVLKTDYWCYNCDYYGMLYKWTFAMGLPDSYSSKLANMSGTRRGICPVGWHAPSPSEMSFSFTRSYGMYNYPYGNYSSVLNTTQVDPCWWTTGEYDATAAKAVIMDDMDSLRVVTRRKTDGCYLRCIRNK